MMLEATFLIRRGPDFQKEVDSGEGKKTLVWKNGRKTGGRGSQSSEGKQRWPKVKASQLLKESPNKRRG